MDSTTKLAVAVVAAAVILVCGYVAYNEHVRSSDTDQAQRALDAFRQNAQELAEQGRRAVQVSEQQQAAEQAWQQRRRRLAVNQRCVGGVVIQVQGNAYTQLGTIAQAVHCSGDFADQPLR
jgi:Tfp pilus assembly protein PilE